MIEAGDVVFLQWRGSIAQRFLALTSASGIQPVLLVRETVYLTSKATCVHVHWDTGVADRIYLFLEDPVAWPCDGVEKIINDQETSDNRDVFRGSRKLSPKGLIMVREAALSSGMGSDYKDMIRKQS